MRKSRPALFRGRHFREDIIVLCVRWYLRYPLTYRDLEEMMAERGLTVDHSTIARWVLHYAPILEKRIRPEMRQPNRSWRVRLATELGLSRRFDDISTTWKGPQHIGAENVLL